MSNHKHASIQRAAGGASAAGAVVVNGLPRASGKADAEYARRRWALRDQRPAYDRMRKEGAQASSRVAPQEVFTSCPSSIAETGFFVFPRRNFYEAVYETHQTMASPL